MKDYSNHIAIVGAGISGLALGIILQRNKIPCVIFEKSEKINEYGAGISISPNGLVVLKNLDVLNDLKLLSRRPDSAIFFSNNNKINQISVDVLTTTRKSLYKVLIDKFNAINGEIHFSHEVEDIDNETKILKLNTKKTEKILNFSSMWGTSKSIKQTMNWYKKFYEGTNSKQLCLDDIKNYEKSANKQKFCN